jgi:hypothetical protein
MASRPFYFMIALWGQRYREHFYSLCVPSLLAPNNIPVLKNRPGCKLIIATTVEDWDGLKYRPLIRQLATMIELFPIFIGKPGDALAHSAQLHAAHGHRLACRKAYQDGAYAGWLTPDLIISDGLIKKAVDFIDGGKKVVLCPALRFEMEHPIATLSAAGYLQPDQPLSLSAEYLSEIAVKSLHPELLCYEFNSEEFGDYPIWSFWRIPARDGLVLYTVSWSLLFADFAAIPQYQDQCFDYSTNDGIFAHLNFGHLRNSQDLAFISDSYDGVFLSLTPRNELPLDTRIARFSNKIHAWFRIGDLKRLADIRRFHDCDDIDPFRRHFHTIPITIHGDPIDARYRAWIQKTQQIMLLATGSDQSASIGQYGADRGRDTESALWEDGVGQVRPIATNYSGSLIRAYTTPRRIMRFLTACFIPAYAYSRLVIHVCVHLVTGKKTIRYVVRRTCEELGWPLVVAAEGDHNKRLPKPDAGS